MLLLNRNRWIARPNIWADADFDTKEGREGRSKMLSDSDHLRIRSVTATARASSHLVVKLTVLTEPTSRPRDLIKIHKNVIQ